MGFGPHSFKVHRKRSGAGHRAHHLYCPPNKETKVAGLSQDPGARELGDAAGSCCAQMCVFSVPPAAGLARRKRAEESSHLRGYPKRTSCKPCTGPGARLGKTAMGFCLGVQTVYGWISPEIILGLENRGSAGRWPRLWADGCWRICWKGSPCPRWTAQEAPGPWGSGGGLFHFKVKICRLWETIFKKVYNLHMPLNGGSSIYSGR